MAAWRMVWLPLAIWASSAWGAVPEPMPLRLLRTVYIGAPQLPVGEIQRYATDGHTGFYGYVLARSALTVLGENRDWTAAQSVQLLERSFELLDTAQTSLFTEGGMRAGFGTDDVLFTLVYALVQSGQGDQAVTVSARQLDSTNEFTRAVALQALRYIGNPRASDILKGKGREDKDSQLRANLLADIYFPFFDDLARRQSLIAQNQRDRRTLLTIAKEQCGEQPALAMYWLGFVAPSEDAGQQQAELEVLRVASGLSCYYSRYLALRALALRRDGTPAVWVDRYRREQDVWVRAQMVRSAYTIFGRSFLSPALGLLATEPSQYVQWELLHGNLAIRQGYTLRDEWDLWIPATLQFRLDHHGPASLISSRDMSDLLGWFEQGKRPGNQIVRNILLWDLARAVPPEQTRRFLRVLHRQPEKSSAWWVLDSLSDPNALPMLRYWATLPAGKEQLNSLKGAILKLETQTSQGKSGNAPECCLPERACLVSQVRRQERTTGAARIETEPQALVWLGQKDGKSDDFDIRFIDPLERIAEVRLGAAAPQRWEHLYGCWQRVDNQ
jgi:hypothetical protein